MLYCSRTRELPTKRPLNQSIRTWRLERTSERQLRFRLRLSHISARSPSSSSSTHGLQLELTHSTLIKCNKTTSLNHQVRARPDEQLILGVSPPCAYGTVPLYIELHICLKYNIEQHIHYYKLVTCVPASPFHTESVLANPFA